MRMLSFFLLLQLNKYIHFIKRDCRGKLKVIIIFFVTALLNYDKDAV